MSLGISVQLPFVLKCSLFYLALQVHLTGRHFNDRAAYTCDDGYQIVGLENVICNSNGHWSGAQPSCKQGTSSAQSRYYCGTPTIIQHAKHNGSSEQVSSTLETTEAVFLSN